MARTRTHYEADFKAKVALEAIVGNSTDSEIAKNYGITVSMLGKWKDQALEGVVLAFTKEKKPPKTESKKVDVGSMVDEAIERLKTKEG